jgi:rRNA maturation endonuclease Nob1
MAVPLYRFFYYGLSKKISTQDHPLLRFKKIITLQFLQIFILLSKVNQSSGYDVYRCHACFKFKCPGDLMCHCGTHKNTQKNHLTG